MYERDHDVALMLDFPDVLRTLEMQDNILSSNRSLFFTG
jgi:hypothetical protein